MKQYTQIEINNTITLIESTIINCQKTQLKFKEGSSQHTLLKNRIKALQISKTLILNNNHQYTQKEIENAIPPITSIIHKSQKALSHTKQGTGTYTRLTKIINAMIIALDFIQEKKLPK